MKQYALLAFLSPVASLLAVTGPAQSEKLKTKTNPQKQPNVIFIYADDLGYGDLECYGAKNVQTPHVNQLAESGVQFTNAHATAATSTPSRYSMLTGNTFFRHPLCCPSAVRQRISGCLQNQPGPYHNPTNQPVHPEPSPAGHRLHHSSCVLPEAVPLSQVPQI